MAASAIKETEEHDDTDGGGASVVTVFELALDEVGDDLALPRMRPEMKMTEPYTPTGRWQRRRAKNRSSRRGGRAG